MSIRLLIDECLSPSLVTVAHAAGFECTCARDRGLLAATDWRLIAYAIAKDYILVTNNAADFRGKGANCPGGLYSHLEIHPGLICLCSAFQMTFARQCRLFQHALVTLTKFPDLMNQVLDVLEDQHSKLCSIRYKNPGTA